MQKESKTGRVVRGVTPRSLVVGTIGSVAIGTGVPYVGMMIYGERIAALMTTAAALILFFYFVFLLNALVGALRRQWMLTRPELALIYIMWIIATPIPERGLTSFLLPHITSVIYYATPENNWDSLFPFIPDWMIPHHDFEQIKYFYEGAPQGQGIPWELWLPPLAWWLPFIFALYLAMIAIMVILRRQWIVNERLIYPLVQVPLAMIEDDETRPSLIKPLFRNPLMWAGFAITALIYSNNRLSTYYPFFERISLWEGSLPLFRGTVDVDFGISFQLVGFAYFINRNVAFSLWFFYLFGVVQQGIFNTVGVQRVDPLFGVYSRHADSILTLQGFGAFMVLVLFGLWTARGHLYRVFRRAFLRDPGIDDQGEIMSYRAAAFTLIGSLLFMGVWLAQSGLPGWIVPIYLFFAFALFVAITRVVAEGGLAWNYAPMIASDFVAAGFGTRALGESGIISLSFTYVWASDILTFVMASCANGLKVAEETIRSNRRLIFLAIMIAIAVSIASSIWMILTLAYAHGGINTDGFFFGWGARYPFENASARIQSLEGPHWENWGFAGIGAAAMGLLMLARQRFLWWPLHPLGLPLSAVFGSAFFSVFLGWLFKTAIVKFGGVRVYVNTRPFFIGIILGQFATSGVWFVVHYFAAVR
ncbi:MAG: hypothetical protein OXH50_05435 [Gemmatimonadetes bacterium]|nr:hypothetical protein [Gemmatimonadota bacterium]